MATINVTPEELDKSLVFFMRQHVGRANAIDRWTLVAKIFGEGAAHPFTDDNLYDRAIREAVSRLRMSGIFICDMSDGSGRFLAADRAEYLAFRNSYVKPLISRAEVIRAMDKFADEAWPNEAQPALFDMSALRIME